MTSETTMQDGFIVLSGLRFHYRACGVEGAPALLLLHGLTGHARTWDMIATAFADRFHVLALDLRGHGETDWAPAYSYDLFADDVEQFAAQLRLHHFALLGQSLGAEVAYAYTAREPRRLSRLVIVDRGPGSISAIAVAAILAQTGARAQEVFDDPQVPIQAAAALARASAAASTRALVAHNLVQAADSRWRWRYDAAGIARATVLPEADQWAWLARIRCPTLIVRGAESPVLSRECAERMVRAIPTSRWTEVPESGHNVQADNLAGFLEAVRPFLLAEERER